MPLVNTNPPDQMGRAAKAARTSAHQDGFAEETLKERTGSHRGVMCSMARKMAVFKEAGGSSTGTRCTAAVTRHIAS